MWDVSKGEVLRVVQLGEADDSVFIRQIIAISNSVVCDYGNQLRVIYFPAVLETKSDWTSHPVKMRRQLLICDFHEVYYRPQTKFGAR